MRWQYWKLSFTKEESEENPSDEEKTKDQATLRKLPLPLPSYDLLE